MIQSVVAFICPLMYCVLIGWAWSKVFRKSYLVSIAPACILGTLLVLLSGLTVQRLSAGLYAGIVLACAVLIGAYWRQYRREGRAAVLTDLKEMIGSGLGIFIILYCFCFILNTGKSLQVWDEFSHWGPFVKISYFTDRLYCTSAYPCAHKDYVPFTTLFEYIWCRLSHRYQEADLYRAMQMLMFSMILPVFRIWTDASDRRKSYRAVLITGIILVLLLPFCFRANDGFRFYHSIYCDYISGVFLFIA